MALHSSVLTGLEFSNRALALLKRIETKFASQHTFTRMSGRTKRGR
jgi:hypothetical protein